MRNEDEFNDVGFSDIGFNDVGFNKDSIYNDVYGETDTVGLEYLESFYNDCIAHKCVHDKVNRNSSIKYFLSIVGTILAFVLIIIGAGMKSQKGQTLLMTGMVMFFAIPIIYSVFNSKYRKKKKLPDDVNYDILDKYLSENNLKKFCDGESRCLTKKQSMNRITVDENYSTPDSKLVSKIMFGVIAFGTIIGFASVGKKWSVLIVLIICSFFAGAGIGLFVFSIVKKIYMKKNYNEVSDAVCVEINKHSTFDNKLRYRPVYYVKRRNGQSYILFKEEFSNYDIPNIGDVVKLKINPNNPVEWSELSPDKTVSMYLCLGMVLTAIGIGFYVFLLMVLV